MTDIKKTISFTPMTLGEIIGEKEAEQIYNENPSNSDIIENMSFYDVSIIVDGYHIREPFLNRYKGNKYSGSAMHKLVESWVRCVENWVFHEYMHIAEKDHDGLSMHTIGYDAMLDEDKNDEEKFSNEATLKNFQDSRFNVHGKIRTLDVSAIWNICTLKVREGGVAFQSGVDARIATQLFIEADKGADLICLVTADGDFGPAISYIKTRYKNVKICVLSYNNLDRKKELVSSSDAFYRMNRDAKLEDIRDFIFKG
ncbi:NYN domain-containing protein [Gluconacetobacter sp. 1b LMG 1731]|uniref:NYN domain-containing protein n=1 Tax=Gluconacetobacter dulcium TaxID=2729096 RepID=A0A7W4NUU1_9PROT|nr:NYN domain-containing protein [Gluconacetobacter dulcium]MBB2164638.1 NYN domain-containing protein [Gluconacetobacter dulcium]MBB2193774.1 NYN domain-containing protein [Gluconacetobacter dulcium]